MPRLQTRQAVTQPLDKPYRFIPLTQGKVAVVDAANFCWLSRWNWYAAWDADAGTFYARRSYDMKSMHSLLLKCHKAKTVDHINGNGLDNRCENLRVATRAQNSQNQGTRINNTSGFKGVTKRGGNRWHARIGVGRKRLHIGYFETAENAAHAYDEAAKRLHGEFAKLNFPQAEQKG